jgi:hypothetical protein
MADHDTRLDDLLTVREAAAQVGIARHRIHAWVLRGLLVSYPGHPAQLVSLAAVQALADQRRVPHDR